MKNLYLILLVLSSSLSAFSDAGLELIPKGRPFRMSFADPREVRMALSFEGSSKIDATIGNYFSLFGIRSEDSSDWFFHVGLEGCGFFTMRQSDNRFPLETADGLIGVYTETAVGPFQYQFRFTHISAHLADGSTDGSIPYSRETAILRAGYLLNQDTHFYAGIHYMVNTIPKLPRWSYQLGATSFFHLFGGKAAPFAAFDLKHKSDVSTNPSLSTQIGIAFGNPPDIYKSFRFFYSYFTGTDPRGQYYTKQVTEHAVGIEMQI